MQRHALYRLSRGREKNEALTSRVFSEVAEIIQVKQPK